MRELALVLPDDVWLTDAHRHRRRPTSARRRRRARRSARRVAGPALELVGCTVSQEAVGGFVATLRDIDGVTRVARRELGAARRRRPAPTQAEARRARAAAPTTDDCRTRDFIAQFEIVAAFDEVPVPAAAPTPRSARRPGRGRGRRLRRRGGRANTEQAAEIVP